MKLAVKIVLFVFVSFIITPTVVSVIKNDADMSLIYSMAEEEETHKCHKEIAGHFKSTDAILFSGFDKFRTSLINSEHSLKHDNVISKILTPPPDLI